jgi:hypothetical protein
VAEGCAVGRWLRVARWPVAEGCARCTVAEGREVAEGYAVAEGRVVACDGRSRVFIS